MAKILLTRSKGENQVLKEKIVSLGLSPIEFSLIEFENYNFDFLTLKNYYKIVLTSKYATQLLAGYYEANLGNLEWFKDLEFYNVGILSAQILKKLGLKIIYTAPNVKDLNNYLVKLGQKNLEHKTIYLSGENITMNLMTYIKREVIYKVTYRKAINAAELEKLSCGVDYILLYSLACAKVLINLFERYNLSGLIREARYITLSKKVMKYIAKYNNNIQYIAIITASNLKQIIND